MALFENTKEDIAGIIMRTEILSAENGVSVFSMLYQYADDLKKEKKAVATGLKDVARRLQNGQKRHEAYKKYLDADILRLLKVSEQKNIPAGEIFKKYVPVKDIADSSIRAIKKGLRTPLVTFSIISIVFSFIVGNFKQVSDIAQGGLSPTAIFIMDYYLIICGSVLVLFAYLFFVIPDKLPLLKGIFKKLKGLLILSSVTTLQDMGFGASETIPVLVSQFGLARKKKDGENAKALAQLSLIHI